MIETGVATKIIVAPVFRIQVYTIDLLFRFLDGIAMRIQYSLKSFIGFVLIATMSLGWREASKRHELALLRHKHLLKEWVQPLEVEHLDRIYYRELPIRYAGLERWKVYLPPGNRYELQCVISSTSESQTIENVRAVARIPMPPGQSLFQANWRRDKQGNPLVSIAVLGPTPEETITRPAQFPPEFCEVFSRTRGINETSRGHEESEYCAPVPWIPFVTSWVPFRTQELPSGEIVTVSGGFQVWIRTNEEKGSKRTEE